MGCFVADFFFVFLSSCNIFVVSFLFMFIAIIKHLKIEWWLTRDSWKRSAAHHNTHTHTHSKPSNITYSELACCFIAMTFRQLFEKISTCKRRKRRVVGVCVCVCPLFRHRRAQIKKWTNRRRKKKPNEKEKRKKCEKYKAEKFSCISYHNGKICWRLCIGTENMTIDGGISTHRSLYIRRCQLHRNILTAIRCIGSLWWFCFCIVSLISPFPSPSVFTFFFLLLFLQPLPLYDSFVVVVFFFFFHIFLFV